MADKCISEKTLSTIKNKAKSIFINYKLKNKSADALQRRIEKLLKEIVEMDISLTDIPMIVNSILEQAVKTRSIEQGGHFLNMKHLSDILSGAIQNVHIDNVKEADHNQLTETKQADTKLEVTQEFLSDAYGSAIEVKEAMVRVSKRHLFDACLINRGSLGAENIKPINSLDDLNDNIRTYQNYLFKQIKSYLTSVIKGSSIVNDQEVQQLLASYSLFDKQGKYNEIPDKIQAAISYYLSPENFNPTVLKNLYNKTKDSSNINRLQDKMKLDAYNAYVLLKHFDSYLALYFPGVQITKDFNRITGDADKYGYKGKTAKVSTTWATDDQIVLEEVTGDITKTAITTSPKYIRWSNTPMGDQMLSFTDFEHIIAKIKDIVYRADAAKIVFDDNFIRNKFWKQLTPETQKILRGKRLVDVISYIRKNPRKYVTPIFEVLSNKDFFDLEEVGSRHAFMGPSFFTDDELDKLWSLSKNLFSRKENNSLFSLSNAESGFDFYNYLMQTVDSIFSVQYLQYYRDADGLIQVRTFIDQSINNINRKLEENINISNSVKAGNYKSFAEAIDLQPTYNANDTKKFIGVTFTLPVSTAESTAKYTVEVKPNQIIIKNQGKIVTDYSILWRQGIEPFIDDLLKIGISQNPEFKEALFRKVGEQSAQKQLVDFACRIVLHRYVANNMLKGLSPAEMKKKANSIYGNNAPAINGQLRELGMVSAKQDVNILKQIAITKANLYGVTTASQTKDGDGNGQSLHTTSRLLGSLTSQWAMQEKQSDSATRDISLLTVDGLYEGVYTAREYCDIDGTKNSIKMNPSELLYAGFVQDFVGGLIPPRYDSSPVGGGHVLLLPSVNSDKDTSGRIRINLNMELDELNLFTPEVAEKLLQNQDFKDFAISKGHEVANIIDSQLIYAPSIRKEFREYLDKKYPGSTDRQKLFKTVPIKDMTSKQLDDFTKSELFSIYNNIINQVSRDFDRLEKFLPVNLPTSLRNDFFNNFTSFNLWWTTEGSHEEAIGGKTVRIGNTYGETSPVGFIKEAVRRYNETHKADIIELIDQVHFKSSKGNLSINDAFISQLARFMPNDERLVWYRDLINMDKYPSYQEFQARKETELLQDMLKSKFRINLGSEQAELSYIKDRYGDKWVNSSNDMILARVSIAGTQVNNYPISSNRDLYRLQAHLELGSIQEVFNLISNRGSLELMPLLKRYNQLDYLFTQEFMISTVGSFIAHPEKSIDDPSGEETNKDRVLRKEAAHFQAQHKRNVSFTAAMHEFQLNALNGIPETYNIAVMEDITDYQGTILGDINKIKPFDGATFVNPFIVHLENNSLGEAKAGITKKQFVHFKSARTGTGGIIKTAGFGLTNDWIRNSPFLERMMRKMTNRAWTNQQGVLLDTNFLRDYNGNSTLIDKELYYKQGNKVYKIQDIQKVEGQVNTYTRTLIELKKGSNGQYDGTIADDAVPILDTQVIDSNYKLWNFLGGKNSMSKKNGSNFLSLSEASIKNVVAIMNQVGTKNPESNSVETQEDVYQPLKHSDIHYIPTEGAVKQGAANINSADKYFTEEEDLDIQQIKMYQAGIQLDKEHHADDSELSLMTQVISACAAKGYTFEQASALYDALRTNTDIATKDHLDAVRQVLTAQSREQLQEVVMKSIIRSLSTTTNSNSFAVSVAQDLINRAKKGEEIKFSKELLPLSDNTVYAKIFSAIASYLTNSGIKQKIPGLLSVLTPSYGIQKLWAGRKYESFEDPERELAELQLEYDANPVFDIEDLNTNISKLELGRYYKIQSIGEDGSIQEESRLINTPTDYYKLKVQTNTDDISIQDLRDFSISLHSSSYVEGTPEYQEWFNWGNQIWTQYNGDKFQALTEEEKDLLYNAYKVSEESEDLLRALEVLKKIKNPVKGQVIKVIEDVTKGRDLASYNVRYTTTEGESFQLWDLDSARALYTIQDLIKEGGEENLQKIAEIARQVLNRPINIEEDLPNIPIWINRVLQRDLMNLSKVTPDIMSAYQELLDSKDSYINTLPPTEELQNAETWYDKYARWVNIALGRGDGKVLKLMMPEQVVLHDGTIIEDIVLQEVEVTSENFEKVQEAVEKLLTSTTQVKINGKQKTINKESIEVSAYEIIMPKTFATNFGLDEFADLAKISSDTEYFIKQFLKNRHSKIQGNRYTFELKVSNGNHYYLQTKHRVLNSGLTKIPFNTTYIDGQKYRVDIDGNPLYEITDDFELYQDREGTEVIVSNDLGFYINNLRYDSVQASNDYIQEKETIDFILNEMVISSNPIAERYANFVMQLKSDPKEVDRLNRVYNSISIDLGTDGIYALALSDDLPTFVNTSIKNIDGIDYTVGIDSAGNKFIVTDNILDFKNYIRPESNYIIKMGLEKHTSFLKALDVVAARIPAQSMQSFMPMKIVAFDNPDINTAYVSTMQILLQGSDYDIDAVSLATYDISHNGKLELWSPYANISNMELMNASMQLPFPTGKKVELKQAEDIEIGENERDPYLQYAVKFFSKYTDILDIRHKNPNHRGPSIVIDYNQDIQVRLKTDTKEQLQLLKQFLEEVPILQIPSKSQLNNFRVLFNKIYPGVRLDNKHFSQLFEGVMKIVNDHNIYFDKKSIASLTKIVNNYTMYSMYSVSEDPVNLLQAHSSVDITTGPLKAKAETSEEAAAANFRTPGNVMNKFFSFVENQTGKDGISICAVGLKSFFGLTQYYNQLLNKGDERSQSRACLGDGGIRINGKLYQTLANIRPLNPNTIINRDLFKALSERANDVDAALILSAMLSLATDNAKELALSKLNASTKTLGLYIYGISIGMEFNEIADIMMSDVGKVINDIMDDNKFTGKTGYSRISSSVYNYFEKGPNKQVYKYSRETVSFLQRELGLVCKGYNLPIKKDKKDIYAPQLLQELAKSNDIPLIDKIRAIADIRKKAGRNPEIHQLLDFAEDYIHQAEVIRKNHSTFTDIMTLAEGAEEMRVLGQLLGLNKGLKATSDEFINQVNNIERAIFNKSGQERDLIDLTQFAFNEEYRQKCIERYEDYKHSFNILEVIATVPHLLGYVQQLATAQEEIKESFKYRSIKALSLPIVQTINQGTTYGEDKVIKGIQNYVGSYLCKTWMRSKGVVFTIPANNIAYTSKGEEYILTEDTPIPLGTDWGNATFKRWFETEVIPNLKEGKVGPNKELPFVKHNLLIRDLGNSLFTKTISKNASVVLALPINMMPKIDRDRILLDQYKEEFNKIAGISYSYNYTMYENGEKVTYETKGESLLNLFTYYAMIANDWKLSESSLVPLLEGYASSGIIKEFHDFESALDKQGMALNIHSVPWEDIASYVVPFGNPYTSFSQYLQVRDKNTGIYFLAKKPEKRKYATIGNYKIDQVTYDQSVFPSRLQTPTRKLFLKSTFNDKEVEVAIESNIEDDSITDIILDRTVLDDIKDRLKKQKMNELHRILNTSELNEVDEMAYRIQDKLTLDIIKALRGKIPTYKQKVYNSEFKKPNMLTLMSIINDKLNPC